MKLWRKERGLSTRPTDSYMLTNKDKINEENIPSGSTNREITTNEEDTGNKDERDVDVEDRDGDRDGEVLDMEEGEEIEGKEEAENQEKNTKEIQLNGRTSSTDVTMQEDEENPYTYVGKNKKEGAGPGKEQTRKFAVEKRKQEEHTGVSAKKHHQRTDEKRVHFKKSNCK